MRRCRPSPRLWPPRAGPRAALAAVLCVVWSPALARARGAPDAATDLVRWYVIPNLAYDSDDGLGAGASGELAFVPPGADPYLSAFFLQGYASTRGFQNHRLRWDRLGLGPEGRLRLTVFLNYRHWLSNRYYGLGNGSGRERAYVGSFAEGDARRTRYSYQLIQPYANLGLHLALGGAWLAQAALDLKWTQVRLYQGSLLEEERPTGMAGGWAAQAMLSLVYDSRWPEINPRQGLLLEVSGRWLPPLPGPAGSPGAFGFGGPFASGRAFYSLLPGLVLAGRVMAEWLLGRVPFYEMEHWGGPAPIPGFGGYKSLRGLPFNRWHGPGKAVANLELRAELLRHLLFDNPVRWDLVPFADAGLVFGGPQSGALAAGWPVHPSAGLGLRLTFQEVFVLSCDAALGVDPIVEPDGRVSAGRAGGVYVSAWSMF